MRALSLAFAFLSAAAAPATPGAHDHEWPPVADPHCSGNPPAPGLAMGSFQITIPSEFQTWFNHTHDVGGWHEWPLWATFGDIEGLDDGDMDVVLHMATEVVLGARVTIDWTNKTGSLLPLWAFKDPSTGASPPTNHVGSVRRNALIWDLDGDGDNEVAFVAKKKNSSGAIKDGIYVVDPNSVGPGPYFFTVPEPLVLASTIFTGGLGDRVGVARLSHLSAEPRHIWTSLHYGNKLQVWELQQSGGTYSLPMVFQKDAGTGFGARVHEFNAADVDGDGYDEFLLDGVIDFVDDAGGVADPVNGTSGDQIWNSGMTDVSENHIDHMIAADFDPSHPGLEINSTPSQGWTDWKGTPHTSGKNLMWDVSGNVLRENLDGPCGHTQTMFIGNWTATRDGFETLYIPKGSTCHPPGEVYHSGGFAEDALQSEIAFDGAMWKVVTPPGCSPNNCNLGVNNFRGGGPAYWVTQIDWDGDYASDEMLDFAWSSLYVWRLGEKGDWGATPPPGMPTQAQVGLGWTECGQTQKWWWYESDPAWYWNNGGPGRYTHYYQKLGETFAGNLYFPRSFDVGGDYREEAVAFRPGSIDVYYNPNAVANPWLHRSPRESKVYRRFATEMELVKAPLVYLDLPVLERVVVTPQTVGTSLNGTATLSATAHYSDGAEVDVTNDVSWFSEFPTVVAVQAGGTAQAQGMEGSARIFADLAGVQSEPGYVYASSDPEPSVLVAGYEETYLIAGDLGPILDITARVAQKDNEPLLVFVNLANGTLWQVPPVLLPPSGFVWLNDDGDPAHGDDAAGDGIYSTRIPYAGHPTILAQGDHLRQVQATLQSDFTKLSTPSCYLIISTTNPPTWTNRDITGQYDNDAQGEALTPRIAWCGFRGFQRTDFAFVEAKVEMPSDPDVVFVGCAYSLNGGPYLPMSLLYGSYVATIDIQSLPVGTYFVDVRVWAKDGPTGPTVLSDTWPRLRVHVGGP